MFNKMIEINLMITIIYLFLIGIFSSYIYFKTSKVYELTQHEGIRFFRQAFLFYGISFFSLGIFKIFNPYTVIGSSDPFRILLGYMLSIAGFLIVFSMIWKDFEDLSSRISLLHGASIIISFVDSYEFKNLILMVQIAVFSYALIILYNKYKSEKKSKFLQLYLIGIILGLIGYMINFASILISIFVPSFRYFTYAFTATIFALVAYIVHKSLK